MATAPSTIRGSTLDLCMFKDARAEQDNFEHNTQPSKSLLGHSAGNLAVPGPRAFRQRLLSHQQPLLRLNPPHTLIPSKDVKFSTSRHQSASEETEENKNHQKWLCSILKYL